MTSRLLICWCVHFWATACKMVEKLRLDLKDLRLNIRDLRTSLPSALQVPCINFGMRLVHLMLLLTGSYESYEFRSICIFYKNLMPHLI